MNIKKLQLILAMFGLSSCLIRAADAESKLAQQNSDWHITSGSFSNAPFFLVPSNAPVWFYPLVNGQWVWATNMEANFNNSMTNGEIDANKLHQVQQQESQRIMNEIDPPGIAHVPEYNSAWHGKYHWNTNVVENWQGTWVEDTNTGWRVNLRFIQANKYFDATTTIHVGSVVTNSGAGLLPTPDGKFAKLELLDANGKTVPAKRGAAMKLYLTQNVVLKESEIINSHPPSDDDASVERNYPDTISDLEYPRRNVEGGFYDIIRKGKFFHFVGFVSNGPPCQISYIIFNDIFDIKTEGDYTLTVQPVLYRMHYDGGTFQGYLDRVDLPSVTTKVHLVPNVK